MWLGREAHLDVCPWVGLQGSGEGKEGYLVNGAREATVKQEAGQARVLDLAHGGGRHVLMVQAQTKTGPACGLRLLALDGVDLVRPREVSLAYPHPHILAIRSLPDA